MSRAIARTIGRGLGCGRVNILGCGGVPVVQTFGYGNGGSQNFVQGRSYTDLVDLKATINTLNTTDEILNYYGADVDTYSLEAILRGVGRLQGSKRKKTHAEKDPRFIELLVTLGGRLEDADARCLSFICRALSFFPYATPEMTTLGTQLAEVIVRRDNAFLPSNLASIATGLSKLRINDPALSEFLRVECVKTLQNFSPTDLHQILQAFHQFRSPTSREFVEMVVEKMSDEIDRFTTRDVQFTLKVLSDMGAARGFLLRRLSTLAMENLVHFSTIQLVDLLVYLANLRFLGDQDANDIVDVLKRNVTELNRTLSRKLLNGLASLQYQGNASFVDTVVSQAAADPNLGRPDQLVDLCHSLCCLGRTDVDDVLKTALESVFSSIGNSPIMSKGRTFGIKLWEIINCLELEKEHLGIEIPPGVRSLGDEADRSIAERTATSRLSQDVSLLLDSLSGSFKIQTQRNQSAGNLRVDLLDEDLKIVLELDTLHSIPKGMKMRHLRLIGYHPILIDFWKWRLSKATEEKQMKYIKELLTPALRAVGKLQH